jgi:hypothetical protein
MTTTKSTKTSGTPITDTEKAHTSPQAGLSSPTGSCGIPLKSGTTYKMIDGELRSVRERNTVFLNWLFDSTKG